MRWLLLSHPLSFIARDETLVISFFDFYFIFPIFYRYAFTTRLQGMWTKDKPHMRGK